MRFASSIFALSSLFAASLAAPAPQSNLPAVLETGDVTVLPTELDLPKSDTEDLALSRRTQDNPIIVQLTGCVENVKGHTASINKTIAGQIDLGNKGQIIGSVKSEISIIIQLVTSIIGEVTGLLTGSVAITGEIKDEVVKLVFGLIVEILFTLQGVLAVLKISIFELLGSTVFLLLSVLLHLLTVLNVGIDGVLALVFGLLGGLSGVLNVVLGGLLGKVQGILGGAFGLVGGLLSCLL